MNDKSFEYQVHPFQDEKLYRTISYEKQDTIQQIIIYLSVLAFFLGACLLIKELFIR